MHAALGPERVLDIVAEVRVVTESSVWLLRPNRYLRMPREERGRRRVPVPDGALDDLAWLACREVVLVDGVDGRRLRIVPASRPAGSRGVVTGLIVAAIPALEDLVGD